MKKNLFIYSLFIFVLLVFAIGYIDKIFNSSNSNQIQEAAESERLPADFDIAGLWCFGEQGVCLKSEAGDIDLYLFGVTAHESQSLKYYATVIQVPDDAIAKSNPPLAITETAKPSYYKADELVNAANIEIGSRNWIGVLYSIPAHSRLYFNGYALNAGDSKITFSDNSAYDFVIRSDCEEKLKYILSKQRPLILNHFQPHTFDFGVPVDYEKMAYKVAMDVYCTSITDYWAERPAAVGRPTLLKTFSRLKPIRFLSATDIELGGDIETDNDKRAKEKQKRLTRIPLSSFQDRIHANDTEMDAIISKLGLADAMQKSKALVHCKTLTGTTLCDTDEFKPDIAKQQLNANKPESSPEDVANSVTPQKSNSAPTLRPESLRPQDVLTALFGNYDREKDRAIIENLAVPVEPGGTASAPVTAESKILWTSPVNYKGTPHQLIVLASLEIDTQGQPYECHACSPIIGAALLRPEGGGWKAVAFTPSIARVGGSGEVAKPVLEAAGESAWVLRFENVDGGQGFEGTVTDLLALMPEQLSEPAYFIKVLSLTTHSDDHAHYNEGCPDDPGCQFYDVKLEYIKREHTTLYDLVATTHGYVEKSHGSEAPFASVDFYEFTGRLQFERNVVKSAELTRQLSMQPEAKATKVAKASQAVKTSVPISSNSIPMPNHVIGDTYVNEVINLADGKHGSTTERRVISIEPTKIVIESKSLSSKKGTVRTLDYTPEWNLIRSRNPDGEGLDYSPPLKYFEFPLSPGKNWQQTSIETNSKTGAQRTHTLSATVGDWEMVTVPAGTFNAIKVITKTELLDQATLQKTTGSDISWYVPELRRSVKSETSSQKPDGSEDKQVIQLLNYKIENYAPAQNALGAMYSEGKGTAKDETHKAAETAKKQTEEKTASEEGVSTHARFLPWLPSGVAETPAQCSHINETAYHEWFDAGAMLTNIKYACGHYGHINAESTCRDRDSGRKYCKEYKINRKNEYFLALKNGWGKNCYMTNGKPSYIEQLENNVDLVVGLCSIIDPDLYKKENDHRKAIHNAIEKIINDALPAIDAEIKEQYEALAAQKAADKKAITPAN